MSPPDGSTTLTLNDRHADEDRMRAALGLAPGPPHPSRAAEQPSRPGRDGQVPVTVTSTPRSAEASDSLRGRLVSLTNELKAERGERVAGQQALADAQRAIQQLQTKLADTEIAAAEASEAEQQARLTAEARLRDVTPPPAPGLTEEPTGPNKRGRPPSRKQVAEPPEQEPVQWWLPSYKAPRAKRVRPKS